MMIEEPYLIQAAAGIARAFCLRHAIHHPRPGLEGYAVSVRGHHFGPSTIGDREACATFVVPDLKTAYVYGRGPAAPGGITRIEPRSKFECLDITDPRAIEEVLAEWERVCTVEVEMGGCYTPFCLLTILEKSLALGSKRGKRGLPAMARRVLQDKILERISLDETYFEMSSEETVQFVLGSYKRPTILRRTQP